MTAAGGSRITNDELARRIDRIEVDVKELGAGIHRRLDELNYVHPETLDTKLLLEQAHRTDLERRVAALEGGNQWLWRTIAGIVLTAVLVGVLAAAGLGQ